MHKIAVWVFATVFIGLLGFDLYASSHSLVNRGLSKSLSVRGYPDYAGHLDAAMLIKSIECKAKADGTVFRVCDVELSTANHPYYLTKGWTERPASITSSFRVKVRDDGGIASGFRYRLDVEVRYARYSGFIGHSIESDEIEGFDAKASISDVKVDPRMLPKSSVEPALRQSLRNVSAAAVSTKTAKQFEKDVKRAVSEDTNVSTYRKSEV